MKLVIINGPNLNLLGRRKPEVYGREGFNSVLEDIAGACPDVEVVSFQSNSEGGIIDTLHRYGFDDDVLGIIINPGAYSHYSYAVADALEAVEVPAVEVHISNIYAREEFRHRSVTAPQCVAAIAGMGLYGYVAAARFLLHRKMQENS